MMISPTGKALTGTNMSARRYAFLRSRAFTLVELILVMALLGVVLAIGAPSLGRFFQGRVLNSEVHRFIGLTRYAQSRAVSEGIPMVIWIDPEEQTYGLQAETTYTETDPHAVEFKWGKDLEIEPDAVPTSGWVPGEEDWRETTIIARNRPALRFTPDGFIAPTSPKRIVIRGEEQGEIWIVQSRTGLHYEIETNTPSLLQR